MQQFALALAVIALALSIQNAAAQVVNSATMLRFPCSQLVVDRVDPLVNPGRRYTPHLHQIVGGNSFNVNMDPVTFDMAARSTCTSCSFAEDFSNYWTAVMFFRARNGTYKRVPQVGNGGPQGNLNQRGGITIYYIPNGRVTAFTKGFRMLAGNAVNTNPGSVSQQNICHRCWTSDNENQFVGGAPCSGSDTVEIPMSTTCRRIRQTLIFPACWDGRNIDSADHKSHVAYGTGPSLTCPSSHPVKIPQIMYEIMWDVSSFTDRNIWPADGSNPFTYSMDLGGSAAHGDYMFGWKDDSLQRAMDNNCNLNTDCPQGGIRAQQPNVYNSCTVNQAAPEAVDGWLTSLPNGNPAPSPAPSPSPATSPDPATCIKLNNQCGGALYTGGTTCCQGTCTFRTNYYSQCR